MTILSLFQSLLKGGGRGFLRIRKPRRDARITHAVIPEFLEFLSQLLTISLRVSYAE